MKSETICKLTFQERVEQAGASALMLTPGTGERAETIFNGLSILTQSGYPLWHLEHVLGPKLEKYLPPDACTYEALVHSAAKLVTTDAPHLNGVDDELRERIGYELLYELLIAPFCYLDNVLNSDEASGNDGEDDAPNSDESSADEDAEELPF